MTLALMSAAAFGGVGIILSVIGYFVFDFVEWRINFAQEIKNNNMAAAVVMASFIIGICYVVGRAIGS